MTLVICNPPQVDCPLGQISPQSEVGIPLTLICPGTEVGTTLKPKYTESRIE